MKWELSDLAGTIDLAKRFGVNAPAVSNWVHRYPDFPQPLLHISGHPVYSYQQVAQWYHGRKWQPGKH